MPGMAPEMLRSVKLLAELDDQLLASLASRMRHRNVAAGALVFQEEDDARHVFFVVAGRVRVTLFARSGREVTFRDLHTGEMFGELAVIDGRPRSAHVVAKDDTVLATLGADEFRAMLRERPDFAMAVLRQLTTLVRALSQRVYEFSSPVPIRVCAELYRLAELARQHDGAVRIAPSPKHADIAGRINTNREAVSRTISDLVRRGIVRKGRGELLVLQLDQLRELADPPEPP